MTWTTPDGDDRPQTWSARLMGAFSARGPRRWIQRRPSRPRSCPPKSARQPCRPWPRSRSSGPSAPSSWRPWPVSQSPPTSSPTNKVTRRGKNTIAVAPDAALLGGAILLLCVIGFLALWKRKRTLVAFDLFLVGFAFTLFIGLIGFAFILLGGWLMLRAWRLNKYGTTNAKAIAQEAATRPRGRERKAAAQGTGKQDNALTPGARKPPTASKRYTPKAPPRKKIPKPTE